MLLIEETNGSEQMLQFLKFGVGIAVTISPGLTTQLLGYLIIYKESKSQFVYTPIQT